MGFHSNGMCMTKGRIKKKLHKVVQYELFLLITCNLQKKREEIKNIREKKKRKESEDVWR